MLLLLSIGLLTATRMGAQITLDPRTTGIDYIIVFPDTVANTTDSRQETDPKFSRRAPDRDTFAIYFYSSVDNDVSITGKNYSYHLPLTANVMTPVYVNSNPYMQNVVVTESFTPSDHTFRVKATYPLVVYCYMVTKFGAEAWTPLPVESWGTDYYVAARPGEMVVNVHEITEGPEQEFYYSKALKPAPAEVVIIALYDSTLVSIRTPSRLPPVRFAQSTVSTMQLDANQAYQVSSYVDTSDEHQQSDVGGTYIHATKPIGVLSGNSRALVDPDPTMLTGNSFRNMLIEWIPPTDLLGTEFVYLPTIDNNTPPDVNGNRPAYARRGEHIRIYAADAGSGSPTVVTEHLDGTPASRQSVSPMDFLDYFLVDAVPEVFTTDRPALGMMNSTAVIRLTGQINVPNATGLTFDSYGPYMVEMTPREQWPTAAPYFAPNYPNGMYQALNYVTDGADKDKLYLGNGQRLAMNHGQIRGTDYYWGTRQLTGGESGMIVGKDGARFYAFVYGSSLGFERFRPGRTRKNDNGGPQRILHPSEYEESTGLAFGYPLSPARTLLRASDSIEIDTADNCGRFVVSVRVVSRSPAGLRRITLAADTNTMLTNIAPTDASAVSGALKAEVVVTPRNIALDAAATILIEDRTGRSWSVPYHYYHRRIEFTPARSVDFGDVMPNEIRHDSVVLTNRTTHPFMILSVSPATDGGTFTVDSIRPRLPITLAPGASVTVWLSAAPVDSDAHSDDSLVVRLDCSTQYLPLHLNLIHPCLWIGDLDFGTLHKGERKTLPLTISNKGLGTVHFDDPALTWIGSYFNVSTYYLEKLKGTKLGSGASITINVSFSSDVTGTYTARARLHATTRECRDTSTWKAVVVEPGPFISGHDWDTTWVTNANVCTKNGVGEYPWDLYLYNSGDRDFYCATIELIGSDAAAGYFVLDSTDRTRTVMGGDLLAHGDTATRRLYQRVLFRPDTEREYSCTIRLHGTDGTEATFENVLHGSGIESHIQIGRVDFGEFPVTTNGEAGRSVELRSRPTRPVTITDLRITGNDPGSFAFDDAAFARPDPAQPATWWHMSPGETRTIPLLFKPASVGESTARIEAIGDQSRCDDSAGVLTGGAYDLTAESLGWTFDDALACDSVSGRVILRNRSSRPVLLRSAALDSLSDRFALHLPPLPVRLAPKGEGRDTIVIPVDVLAGAEGTFVTTVSFDVVDSLGTAQVAVPHAVLTARRYRIDVSTHAARDLYARPGESIVMPITVDSPMIASGTYGITRLHVTATYGGGILRLANGGDPTSLLGGTLLDGWTITDHRERLGHYEATLSAPPGARLLVDTGALLRLRFETFLGGSTTTEVSYEIDAPDFAGCTGFEAKPGSARIDSVCGLSFRLIEMLGPKYSLGRNRPNPFNPSTDIEFSVGLDGQTSLVIYNAVGERVATLVDRYLQPGTYRVTWDATAFPSGLYYYRLSSGDWSRISTMILKR